MPSARLPGYGAITNAMTGLFTALVAFLLYREPIGHQRMIGLITGFVGVIVLAGDKDRRGGRMACSAGGYAGLIILWRRCESDPPLLDRDPGQCRGGSHIAERPNTSAPATLSLRAPIRRPSIDGTANTATDRLNAVITQAIVLTDVWNWSSMSGSASTTTDESARTTPTATASTATGGANRWPGCRVQPRLNDRRANVRILLEEVAPGMTSIGHDSAMLPLR